jgi:dTDP-4-dehydrorhamnose reductase
MICGRGMPVRVLVTGVSGQLGHDVCQELERRNIGFLGTNSAEMDIINQNIVRERMFAYRPDALIHCAAYTAVDRAEEDVERAFLVNEQGTHNLAEVCRLLDAKMVYVSTDYVFPGNGTAPYETSSAAAPLNAYGKSKLAGELAVRTALEKHFIVRTSWVFGVHGNNFVKTMLRLAETRDRVQVVNDQVGSPTYTKDLARLLCGMVETEKYGTYHATNEGVCSWAEFAAAIFRAAGKHVLVEPVTTAEYTASRAIRPLNSRMSKASLTAAGFARLPAWEDALERYLHELRSAAYTPGLL